MCALRVAHVVLALDVGGLERVVLDLAREEAELGTDVAIVCIERPGALATAAEHLGAEIITVGKRPGFRPSTANKIATLLRAWGPDVVHTHNVGALFYGSAAARRAGVRAVVHTEHGRHYAPSFRMRVIGKLSTRRVDRFFCVTRDIVEEVVEAGVAPRSIVHFVPNGINTQSFRGRGFRDAVRCELGIPLGESVIGTVGRLGKVKRQDLLIRSFAAVSQRIPDSHLLIVGEGPQRADLEALAAELGLKPRVHFAGYQSQPDRFLSAMDVFALTSESEGMPLSVLEAWASKVPVVAFAVGGLPELVSQGTGLLVNFGDVDALAAKTVELLTDFELAGSIRDAAFARVCSEFDSRVAARAYRNHYLELLDEASRLPFP